MAILDEALVHRYGVLVVLHRRFPHAEAHVDVGRHVDQVAGAGDEGLQGRAQGRALAASFDASTAWM